MKYLKQSKYHFYGDLYSYDELEDTLLFEDTKIVLSSKFSWETCNFYRECIEFEFVLSFETALLTCCTNYSRSIFPSLFISISFNIESKDELDDPF